MSPDTLLYPPFLQIAAMADTGQTYNTSATVKHILAQKVDMLINSGKTLQQRCTVLIALPGRQRTFLLSCNNVQKTNNP
jgi:hypothetical protein